MSELRLRGYGLRSRLFRWGVATTIGIVVGIIGGFILWALYFVGMFAAGLVFGLLGPPVRKLTAAWRASLAVMVINALGITAVFAIFTAIVENLDERRSYWASLFGNSSGSAVLSTMLLSLAVSTMLAGLLGAVGGVVSALGRESGGEQVGPALREPGDTQDRRLR